MSIYRKMFDFGECLKVSKFSFLYDFLYDIGFMTFVNKYMCWKKIRKDGINTEEIEASLSFYNNNVERILNVESLLYDQESKDIYSSIWKHRCTGDKKYIPNNDLRNIYFNNSFLKYSNGEILVDCGAYIGDSLYRFVRVMNKRKVKEYSLIAFEPSVENYSIIERNYPECHLFKAGVWNENSTLTFTKGGGIKNELIDYSVHHINYNETESIPVVKLDSCEECFNMTMLKIEIQGAELKALQGAEQIILKIKPKIAVTIWQPDENMCAIAEYLHKIVPEYKLYVRHHGPTRISTVLYATL